MLEQFVFCGLLFVIFVFCFLSIVLYDLRFMTSDYHFLSSPFFKNQVYMLFFFISILLLIFYILTLLFQALPPIYT